MARTCNPVDEPRRCRRCRGAEPDVTFARRGLTTVLCTSCRVTAATRRNELAGIAPVAPAPRPRMRPATGNCPAHLSWIRTMRCAAGRAGCGSLIHAHHVRSCTGGGTGMKPGDEWTVPLCPVHHVELHTGGAATFEARHRVNLRALAQALAGASPYLPR